MTGAEKPIKRPARAFKPPLLRAIEAQYAVMQRADFLDMTEPQMVAAIMSAAGGGLDPRYAKILGGELRQARDAWLGDAPDEA
jgi:hypothetical protein